MIFDELKSSQENSLHKTVANTAKATTQYLLALRSILNNVSKIKLGRSSFVISSFYSPE